MMHADRHPLPLAYAFAPYVARHGAWRVLGAALVAAMHAPPRRSRHDVTRLSPRLLRDIGLPPDAHLRPPDPYTY
jgi:hypothetical protein